ncbi:hypothetical protein [Streptomyces mirabilis]|uniref:hypothetical protein n=1 Tax=Streptomyces mirabilis TaxID=68239 RepID=UPI0038008BFF
MARRTTCGATACPSTPVAGGGRRGCGQRKDGFFHRRHLLAEARRHLALVLRGRRGEPGLDEDIVDAAIATHCLDISEPKSLRGRMPAYRFYTARWPLADPPTRRPPDAEPDPNPRPPAGPGDPDTPRLPLEPGEWDIPRVPLLHDRAVIASTVLSARLCTARRTGRTLYDDVVVHQQAAMPEQLLLFAQEQPLPAARPAVDLAALRTDLEALELTAVQIGRIGRAFATVGDEARRRVRKPAHPNPESAHPNPGGAPRAHQPDEQSAHRPHQPRTGQGPGAPG